MRTSSHQYNLTRNIAVDLVEFAGTAEQPQLIYSRECLPTRPASEVFSTSVYQRAENHSAEELLDNLHERVTSLLQQLDVRHSNKDIFEVLDTICTEPSVKAVVEQYLSVAGYTRR